MKNPLRFMRALPHLFRANNQTLVALMARGTTGVFVLNLANIALAFVTSILLARWLGAELFGEYTYVISWVTLAAVAARMGFDLIIPRFVTKYLKTEEQAKLRGLFRFTFLVLLINSVFWMAVADGVAFALSEKMPVMYATFWLAMTLLPLYALTTPFTGFMVGLQRVVRAQFPGMLVVPVLFLSLTAGLHWLQPSGWMPTDVLKAQIVATAIGLTLVILLFLRVARPLIRDTVPAYDGKSWLRSAIPVALMGGMYVINANADVLILGSIHGVESAGIYKAATRGADLILLISTMIGVALAPIISQLHAEQDMSRLQRGITQSARIGFVLALPVCFGLILFGQSFLLLFGGGFVKGFDALVILSITQLVSVAAGPAKLILVMTGNEKVAAAGIAAATVLNIILNLILIPPFGLVGAALATAASTIVSHSLLVVLVRKILGLNSTGLVFRSNGT